jgi:1-acyl-sn-glycerol-3-phosphate acyltransferase
VARAETADDSVSRARSSPFLAAARLTAIVCVTLGMLVPYTVLLVTRRSSARDVLALRWLGRWVRIVSRVIGFHVTSSGPVPFAGSLLTPNHQGYVDLVAVNTLVDCFFVAKADVLTWPVIGVLFRHAREIAVSREKSRTLGGTVAAIAERLTQGASVCVFLEGTSTGGDRVLRFRPPLAQAAVDAGAPVVPTSIRWRARDPLIDIAEDVAYWKDHTFAPHLWRLLGLRGVAADVIFGEPIPVDGHSRKTLAAAAQAAVMQLRHCGQPHQVDAAPR